MIRWEAWCYRCRERESGAEPTEQAANAECDRFASEHHAKCGASASIGRQLAEARPTR